MPGSQREEGQEGQGIQNAAMNGIACGALSSPLLTGQQNLEIQLQQQSIKKIEQEIAQLLKQPPPQELLQERQQQLQIIILQLQKELLQKELQDMEVYIQYMDSGKEMQFLMPQQQQQRLEQIVGLRTQQRALKRKILGHQQIQQQIGLPPVLIPKQGKSSLQEGGHKKMSPEEKMAHEILDAVDPALVGSFQISAIVLMKMAEQKGIKCSERGLEGPEVRDAVAAEREARYHQSQIQGANDLGKPTSPARKPPGPKR